MSEIRSADNKFMAACTFSIGLLVCNGTLMELGRGFEPGRFSPIDFDPF